MNIRYPLYEGVYRILTNYQTFIILPLFYIPQKSVELSHTL